jgi:thioredoxin-like negative regulator of GroEL
MVMISDRELVRTLGIKKIPTIFVLRNAEVTASFVGVVPKETLHKLLKST